jgi:hypothetical protein
MVTRLSLLSTERSGNMAVAKHDKPQSMKVLGFRNMRFFLQKIGQITPMKTNPTLQMDLWV